MTLPVVMRSSACMRRTFRVAVVVSLSYAVVVSGSQEPSIRIFGRINLTLLAFPLSVALEHASIDIIYIK
jgi:hypothetical protein